MKVIRGILSSMGAVAFAVLIMYLISNYITHEAFDLWVSMSAMVASALIGLRIGGVRFDD